MEQNQADYDFLCGNDLKIIKLAMNSDGYHTARIHAESAKHIDLSGGTRNVEEIHFQHCLKLTRVVWPEFTGTIKRLKIIAADSLTHLDLSMFNNLEELSIIKCEKLVEVKGLKDKLKYLNLHQVHLKSVDISRCKNLQVVNVITDAPHFKLEAKELGSLKTIAIESPNIFCHPVKCNNLFTLYLDSGDTPFRVEIEKCPGINDVVLVGGKDSEAIGFSECEKLRLLRADENKIKIDGSLHGLIQESSGHEANERIEEIQAENRQFRDPIEHPEPGEEDIETIIEKRGTQRERNQATFIRINLLSASENEYFYGLKKEYLSFAKPLEDSINRFMHDPGVFMMKVKKMPNIPRFNLMMKSATKYQKNQKKLIAWLRNVEKKNPNVLTIDKDDIDDTNRKVFEELNQRKRGDDPFFVEYAGQKYPLTLAHRVFMLGEGPRQTRHLGAAMFSGPKQTTIEAPVKYKELGTMLSKDQFYEFMIAEAHRLANLIRGAHVLPEDQVIQVGDQMLSLASQFAKELKDLRGPAPAKQGIPGQSLGGAAVLPTQQSSKSSPFLYKRTPKTQFELTKSHPGIKKGAKPGLQAELERDMLKKSPTPGEPLGGASLIDQEDPGHLHPVKAGGRRVTGEPIPADPAIIPGGDKSELLDIKFKDNEEAIIESLELDRKGEKLPADPDLLKQDPALIPQEEEGHLEPIKERKREVGGGGISADPAIIPGADNSELFDIKFKDNEEAITESLERDRQGEKFPADPDLLKQDPKLIPQEEEGHIAPIKERKREVGDGGVSADPALIFDGEKSALLETKFNDKEEAITENLELDRKGEKLPAGQELLKQDPALISQEDKSPELKPLDVAKQVEIHGTPAPEPIAADPQLIDIPFEQAALNEIKFKKEVGEEEYSLGLDKPLKKQIVKGKAIEAEPKLIDDPVEKSHLLNLKYKKVLQPTPELLKADPALIDVPPEDPAHLLALNVTKTVELTLEEKYQAHRIEQLVEAAGVLNDALKNFRNALGDALKKETKHSPDPKPE